MGTIILSYFQYVCPHKNDKFPCISRTENVRQAKICHMEVFGPIFIWRPCYIVFQYGCPHKIDTFPCISRTDNARQAKKVSCGSVWSNIYLETSLFLFFTQAKKLSCGSVWSNIHLETIMFSNMAAPIKRANFLPSPERIMLDKQNVSYGSVFGPVIILRPSLLFFNMATSHKNDKFPCIS